MGTEIVASRLADVLLVEALRALSIDKGCNALGWLGAISDPRLGRTMHAIHREVAEPWTVASLAEVAGMSRAAFSAKFTLQVGRSPLTYLRYWRLTLARSLLLRDNVSIGEVARHVGYTSQSAFSHAYRQLFGTSPRSKIGA